MSFIPDLNEATPWFVHRPATGGKERTFGESGPMTKKKQSLLTEASAVGAPIPHQTPMEPLPPPKANTRLACSKT